jgi:amino acid permease
VHPANLAVGPCPRCGVFMCGLCRTRWDNRTLCLACVQRLLSGAEGAPEQTRAHRRLALGALLLGILAWALTLPVLVVRGVGSTREVLVALLILAMLSLIPALVGLGQAASAIRVRGDRMVLATFGLALAGSQVGTVTGLLLLVIWKQ